MVVITACYVFVLGYASEAHAGIFSSILNLFSADEETTKVDISPFASVSLPLLGTSAVSSQQNGVGGPMSGESPPLLAVQDSALVAPRNPAGTLLEGADDQIILYTVKPGDTPGAIAAQFGISLNTLLWANNIRNANMVKAGDVLVVLPVSGVKYEIKKGDTIESVAKAFKGDPTEILSFNGLAIGENLRVGDTIIVPDGELTPTLQSPSGTAQSSTVRKFSSLPEHIDYYMRPLIGGRRSRGIHGYNGVDLANVCGTPLMASAAGTVIVARTGGWNGGYGKYVVIAHPNGTQTLYGHMSLLYVTVGQHVAQGVQIGLLGSTGNSTGCHAHFEVRGAKNPF